MRYIVKLEAKTEFNEKNRPKYLILVSALPEPLQKKYYGKLAADAQLCLPKVQEAEVPQKVKRSKPIVKKEFGEFNADEREQITFWTDLLREWRIRRREYENCAEGDTVFIAETKRLRRAYLAEHGITLSREILYRKYKAYKDNDLQGLVDGRGGWNKGNSIIPPEVTECFYALYLSDAQLPVADCYRQTRNYVFEQFPEYLPFMASERTFRRLPDKLPPAVIKFFREGEKACIDDCLPYIQRLYDGIEANDVWLNWWRGYYKPFHKFSYSNGKRRIERDLYTLKMGKKVCEDWASILLNSKTHIKATPYNTPKQKELCAEKRITA